MTERVVAVIPARGGSKGLPRKNVLPLGGKPLLAWTIEAAQSCPLIGRVVVSTDDREIAAIARDCNADVPFLRPAELATDATTTEEVLLHALTWMKENEQAAYDVLVYLQVTDPFRRRGIVHEVVRTLMENSQLDTVFAGRPEHKNYWTVEDGHCRPLGRHNHQPRQQKTPVYREDTGIALASRTDVIQSGRRIGDRVAIIPHQSVGDFIDIHDADDLWLANQLIASRRGLPNE